MFNANDKNLYLHSSGKTALFKLYQFDGILSPSATYGWWIKRKNMKIFIEFTFVATLSWNQSDEWRCSTFNSKFVIRIRYKRGSYSRKWKVTDFEKYAVRLNWIYYIECFRVVSAAANGFYFFESAGRWTADYVQVYESGLEKPAVFVFSLFIESHTVHRTGD